MLCQKKLFQLPSDLHYLNCAYMSPCMQSVASAGIHGIQSKSDPSQISAADFFNQLAGPRQKFGQLINAKAEQIAYVPSVSYGLANAMANVPAKPGGHVLTVGDEFPSDYFALKKWADQHQASVKVITLENQQSQKGRNWNERILEAIDQQTSIVNISTVHWMDGTCFDLVAIGRRCREVDAKFIVDGTQSVGAMPIDVQAAGIDVLICASYKWLMGPYSIGLAYYHEDFNQGTPIEESWANRTNAQDFSNLSQYDMEYGVGAMRYNVGEAANFILVPMLNEALRQVLEWGPENIQKYCAILTAPLINFAQERSWQVDEADYRSKHLFGLRLPENLPLANLVAELKAKRIVVSVRGSSIRIAPNVYNDEADIAALMEVLSQVA